MSRDGPDPAVFEPGTWYFDLRDRALVYVVRFPQPFVTRTQNCVSLKRGTDVNTPALVPTGFSMVSAPSNQV